MDEEARETFVVNIRRLGVRMGEEDTIGKPESKNFPPNRRFVDTKTEELRCKLDEAKKSFGDRACLGILWNCHCLEN